MTNRRQPGSIDALLNLGPKSRQWLAAVGIPDASTLRRIGAVEAYRRVKAKFPKQVNVLMLYALHGAIADVHWNDIPAELKAAMRREAEERIAAPQKKSGAPRRTRRSS